MPAISRIGIDIRLITTDCYFLNDWRIAVLGENRGTVGEIGPKEHYVCDWHDGISISEF
jgi:hypothetical protein